MTVEMISWMGSDVSIINGARTSFARQSAPVIDWGWLVSNDRPLYDFLSARQKMGDLSENLISIIPPQAIALRKEDAGLMEFLIRERHGTPFEMVEFKFRVTVPFKVRTEWMRHRVGSYNEVSTRYTAVKPDFYEPEHDDVRVQVGKPGAYSFETADELLSSEYLKALRAKHKRDAAFYEAWIRNGVARELVSFELPSSQQTTFIWKTNFRSLTNFLSLRTALNALAEFRLEALTVEQLVKARVPEAMRLWNLYGRHSI